MTQRWTEADVMRLKRRLPKPRADLKRAEVVRDWPEETPVERRKAKRAPSPGEEALLLQLNSDGIPAPEREVRLIPGRKWQVDFYWAVRRLVVEVEGGTWQKSRHNFGQGYVNDIEKYNALTLAGYRLLRFTTDMIYSGRAIQVLGEVFGARR